jgi:hypothetical protein
LNRPNFTLLQELLILLPARKGHCPPYPRWHSLPLATAQTTYPISPDLRPSESTGKIIRSTSTWPSTFHAVQHYFLVVPTSPLGLIDSERCRRQASFSRHTASIRLLVAAPSKTTLFACCFSLLALVPPPAALPRVSCRLRPDYCRFGLSRTFLYSPTILQAVSLLLAALAIDP